MIDDECSREELARVRDAYAHQLPLDCLSRRGNHAGRRSAERGAASDGAAVGHQSIIFLRMASPVADI